MFFKKSALARKYAKMERIVTGKRHIVIPCKKYLCPPKENWGRDYVCGFTVILHK